MHKYKIISHIYYRGNTHLTKKPEWSFVSMISSTSNPSQKRRLT